MLSKFLPSLKPKEYSVQILRDSTSQSAVKRIKRTRTSAPFRKIAVLTLALALGGGGLASVTAGTMVTANQAEANIISDSICISADSQEAGSWKGGADVAGTTGGRALITMTMNGVHGTTPITDQAYHGDNSSWGGDKAPSQGKNLTAFEKYGMKYPVFDAWQPAYAEKEVLIYQVDSSHGKYDVAGKMPVKGEGTKMTPGASPLLTSDIGSCTGVMPGMAAGVANMISIIPRMVMLFSIELYGAAYGTSMADESSVLHEIGNTLDSWITRNGGLRDTLFIPFLLPLILIGAIWVGYVGIVKRAAMQAVQSTAWMLCAIAFGTVFLAQPTLISSYSDSVVSEMQGVINEAVLQGSSSNEMCDLNGKGESSKFALSVRESKCAIWHSTIYTTWAAGQFGTGTGNAKNNPALTQGAGRTVLENSAYSIWYGSENSVLAQTWPQFMLDRQATTRTPELSEVAWSQLSGAGGATVNNEWAGNIDMVSAATIMFFGAGASSAVLFVYGFTLLLYQLTMIMAVLMSPFFFLFGIVPNWGRRILMRYAEILTSLVVKRIITSLMLAFYLLFYNLIVGDASLGLQVVKILIIFALALFFITSRSKFVGLFADNINFGGNKSVGLPGNKAAAVTAGTGVGLIGGGLIGGAVVASKVRKANKSTEGNVKDLKLEGGNPTADIKTPPRGPNSGSANNKTEVSPTKVLGNVINTAEDIKRVKNLVENTAKNSTSSSQKGTPTQPSNTSTESSFSSPSEATQGSQSASNASTGGTSQGTPNAPSTGGANAAGTSPSPTPQAQASSGTGKATAPASAAGKATAPASAAGKATQVSSGAGKAVAPAGVKVAGGFAGNAGINGAPAAATTVTVSGATTGAVTSGTVGIVSGGAAAAGTVAAGTAGTVAAGTAGTVAAGAAAGSVVPVVGTAIGASAAVVAVKNRKKADENNGEE